ncbi:type II toxin-antitoxin system RelE/ParE family toxin [Botrimarina mediterranea]|uniref:type II toxin-antitoxin system RelE/ParE family toxin n=1 Tax=Botrimarina mediterranea TaxID=2528022 RepID=UPI00118C5C62|nr:hypothetical protein K2D_27000 [Planctomycetes bacterium K2D]
MEISFTNARLAKLCNSAGKLRGKYGPDLARKIQQRLLELQAAETLAEMRQVPAARCHELKANFKGSLAVDLLHPDRLVFRPDHEPRPVTDDGGLDWEAVTKVLIEGIGDYH